MIMKANELRINNAVKCKISNDNATSLKNELKKRQLLNN